MSAFFPVAPHHFLTISAFKNINQKVDCNLWIDFTLFVVIHCMIRDEFTLFSGEKLNERTAHAMLR